MITLNEYQSQAASLCLGSARNINYLTWGLSAETGEALGKLAKAVRDKGYDTNHSFTFQGLPEVKQGVGEELGDCLWFLAVLADFLGMSLGDIAKGNIEKLTSRHDRGVVQGSGDTR